LLLKRREQNKAGRTSKGHETGAEKKKTKPESSLGRVEIGPLENIRNAQNEKCYRSHVETNRKP